MFSIFLKKLASIDNIYNTYKYYLYDKMYFF